MAALGVAGVRETVERLDDRFDHRTYDEVTSFDSRGRPVAISRLDLDGSVGMAVALGWHPVGGGAVDGPGAAARATAAARAAGLAPRGDPEVHASAGAGGWVVSWPRFVGDVQVRGDGLRILLFADGGFHGLTRTERPLADVPVRILDRDEALGLAERALATRAGSRAGDLSVAAVELAWLAPNGRANGTMLDAPDGTLRLAWVVRFEATGPLANTVRSVEVWLDAGAGHSLGGDVSDGGAARRCRCRPGRPGRSSPRSSWPAVERPGRRSCPPAPPRPPRRSRRSRRCPIPSRPSTGCSLPPRGRSR